MKKLLITGFAPFGGEQINPSYEAVSGLPDEIGGYRLHKLLLPVVFGEAAKQAIAAADALSPDLVLCIGQAGGRGAITPEFIGINLRNASIPDEGGNQPKEERIIEGGVDGRFSPLPVGRMAEAIRAGGIPGQVSYSAGAYVCNDLFYTLLDRFAESDTRVGFVHVPYTKEQNKEPSMELSDIIRGLTLAIEALEGEPI